jgi:hypothetical protein
VTVKTNQQFDPIINVAMLPVLGPSALAAEPSNAHTGSVFVAVGDSGEAATGSMAVPALRDRLRRRYWRYELDLTHHPVVLRFPLPASEEAFAFSATVTLLWTVRDPVEVALLGVRDLKPILWTFLNQLLRGVSRQFGIEEVRAAEAEMRLVLEKQAGEVGFGLGLPMVAVSLRLDEDTERYLSQRIKTGRAGHLAGDRHDLAEREAVFSEQQAAWRNRLERSQAEWQGRLERAQAAHQRDLDTARAKHQQDTDATKAAHERTLETDRARHRLELDAAQADHARQVEWLNTDHETQLKEQRLGFYQKALGEGSHDILVLQLIENPGDMGAVLQLIAAGDDRQYTRSREIFDDLVKNELAGASDVDSLTQHIVDQLREALSAAPRRSSTITREVIDERVRTEEKHTDRITKTTT